MNTYKMNELDQIRSDIEQEKQMKLVILKCEYVTHI